MRSCLIFLLTVTCLGTSSCASNSGDSVSRASKKLLKGLSKTATGKKVRKRAERYTSKTLNVSPGTAAAAGALTVGLAQQKISTDSLNIKKNITKSVIFRPHVEHDFEGTETSGSLQLNISF